MGNNMNVRGHPDRILEFRLGGKLAHFRKFYTNASSLTYTIPPRTALAGMFASVLMLPRDSYYDELSSDKLFVAVALPPGAAPRKFMQTMNYIGGSDVSDASSHKQCRFELLTGQADQDICYRIWLGYHCSNPTLSGLEKKLIAEDYGFGIYLGQRQFRAHLQLEAAYSPADIEFLPQSDYVDSAVDLVHGKPFLDEIGSLRIERMPLEQFCEAGAKGKRPSRRLKRIGEIMFHLSGGRIKGDFHDCCKLRNQAKNVISFM